MLPAMSLNTVQVETTGGYRETCAPDVLETPKDHGATQQGGHPCFIKWEQEEAKKRPHLIWTELAPGDVVSLQVHETRDCVGTVESKTSDGLIIWIRDNMNERRLFHIQDCQSVRLVSRQVRIQP